MEKGVLLYFYNRCNENGCPHVRFYGYAIRVGLRSRICIAARENVQNASWDIAGAFAAMCDSMTTQ